MGCLIVLLSMGEYVAPQIGRPKWQLQVGVKFAPTVGANHKVTTVITCDTFHQSSTNMTSLPLKVPPTYEYNAHVKSAYDMCLRVEKSLQEASNNGQNVEKDLICIRILGFLVHNIPTDGGLRTFIYELSSTNGDPALLLRTGKLYFNHFIRACKFVPLSFNVISDEHSLQLKPLRGKYRLPQTIRPVARSTRCRT